MGVMGSDVVAVTCIIAGGVLGGLGWVALDGGEETLAPAAQECSGLIVTPATSPDVVVRMGDGQRIIIARSTPRSADLQVACGERHTSMDELRVRTEKARIRIIDRKRELHRAEGSVLRLRKAPEPPR